MRILTESVKRHEFLIILTFSITCQHRPSLCLCQRFVFKKQLAFVTNPIFIFGNFFCLLKQLKMSLNDTHKTFVNHLVSLNLVQYFRISNDNM